MDFVCTSCQLCIVPSAGSLPGCRAESVLPTLKPPVQASLQALQVLLEKSAPSASPLLRRLPKDQAGHVQVATLLTFLTNPPHTAAGHASSTNSSFLDNTDFRPLDPRSSRAAATAGAGSGAGNVRMRGNLSGTLACSMQSELSGDLRTSEVLFALDTGSEIVPALSSFHFSERTNDITMTDSAALSGAAGSVPVSAYRDRMSASQIPEGQGDASAPSSMIGPSSATSAPPGSVPGSRNGAAAPPPAGASAPTVPIDSARRQRVPPAPTADARIPPLPLNGLARLNVPPAGIPVHGNGKRGRVVGSSAFSRSVRSSPRSSQLRQPSPRSDAHSYSSLPHSGSRHGSWRASESLSGGWRAAVMFDAVSTPGVPSTGHHEFTPRSIYVTAQSPASGMVEGAPPDTPDRPDATCSRAFCVDMIDTSTQDGSCTHDAGKSPSTYVLVVSLGNDGSARRENRGPPPSPEVVQNAFYVRIVWTQCPIALTKRAVSVLVKPVWCGEAQSREHHLPFLPCASRCHFLCSDLQQLQTRLHLGVCVQSPPSMRAKPSTTSFA